jgi:hypothetical protein
MIINDQDLNSHTLLSGMAIIYQIVLPQLGDFGRPLTNS